MLRWQASTISPLVSTAALSYGWSKIFASPWSTEAIEPTATEPLPPSAHAAVAMSTPIGPSVEGERRSG